MKLLWVKWLDSRRNTRDFLNLKEVKEFPLAAVESVGWGIAVEDRIILAQERYLEDGELEEDYRMIISIPSSCVVEKRELVGDSEAL